MRELLFTKIKKAVSVSAKHAQSEAAKKNLQPNIAEMRPLMIEEYSVVAGGPQVENDPQG
jgi:hypothetical protein